MPDYKSRELNIHHTDNNHRFRVLPLSNVAGLPASSFSLSSVSNVGVENALYLPLAYVDTLAGKKSVGVELHSQSLEIVATDQKLVDLQNRQIDYLLAISCSNFSILEKCFLSMNS